MKKLSKYLASFLIAALIAPQVAGAVVIPQGRNYDGDLTISSSRTETSVQANSNITLLSNSGFASTTVSSVTGFSAGDYVMLIQMVGTGAGNYEIQKVRQIVGNRLDFYENLTNTYQATGAQVYEIGEYGNVTVASGGSWSAASWNGTTGGVLVAMLTGSLTVQTGGSVTAPGGFGGGAGRGQFDSKPGFQGDSSTGTGGQSTGANGSGGGGGNVNGVPGNGGGGGAGHSSTGSAGGSVNGATPGDGGATQGTAALSTMFLGAGGGGGACATAGPCTSGSGGSGAGIIFLTAASTTFSGGTVSANGNNGGTGSASGGGAGAGGTIRLPNRLNLTLGSGIVTASAGSGGGTSPTGGGSSAGRIATVSGVTVNGTASPTIDTSSTDTVRNVDNEALTMNLASSI